MRASEDQEAYGNHREKIRREVNMKYLFLYLIGMWFAVFVHYCLVSAGRTKEEQDALDREQREILDRARKG